eukprot:TRINITY_DN19311_c4_g1_i1.p1 TRINITY_DN19311_c4_g1~~TRINITY_DN19311_c4_g1_i1.p1  ORF type:complete len:542 (-),score=86.28 TRINITY_DN19311_c4_g1_i1:358-1983(-)
MSWRVWQCQQCGTSNARPEDNVEDACWRCAPDVEISVPRQRQSRHRGRYVMQPQDYFLPPDPPPLPPPSTPPPPPRPPPGPLPIRCPGGPSPGGSTSPRSLPQMLPGDWICSCCGDLVFARNAACRRCGAERDDGGGGGGWAPSSSPTPPPPPGSAQQHQPPQSRHRRPWSPDIPQDIRLRQAREERRYGAVPNPQAAHPAGHSAGRSPRRLGARQPCLDNSQTAYPGGCSSQQDSRAACAHPAASSSATYTWSMEVDQRTGLRKFRNKRDPSDWFVEGMTSAWKQYRNIDGRLWWFREEDDSYFFQESVEQKADCKPAVEAPHLGRPSTTQSCSQSSGSGFQASSTTCPSSAAEEEATPRRREKALTCWDAWSGGYERGASGEWMLPAARRPQAQPREAAQRPTTPGPPPPPPPPPLPPHLNLPPGLRAEQQANSLTPRSSQSHQAPCPSPAPDFRQPSNMAGCCQAPAEGLPPPLPPQAASASAPSTSSAGQTAPQSSRGQPTSVERHDVTLVRREPAGSPGGSGDRVVIEYHTHYHYH